MNYQANLTLRVVMLLAALGTLFPCIAATVTWTGPGTFWGTDGNWSDDIEPTKFDDLLFDDTASGFVVNVGSADRVVDASFTIDALTAYTFQDTGDDNTLQINGELSVLQGNGHAMSVGLFFRFATHHDIAAGADLTLSGPLTGAGNYTKAGSGTVVFAGANTYTGATTIEAGTLQIADGNETALANTAVTVEAGAALYFADTVSGIYQIGSLAGGGNVIASDPNGSAELEVGLDNTDTIFSGSIVLENRPDISKVGSGTWTLTGDGHRFGELEVDGGAVVLDGFGGDINSLEIQSFVSAATIRNTGASLEPLSYRNLGSLLITGAATEVTLDGGGNQGPMTIEDGAVVTNNVFGQTGTGTLTIDQASFTAKSFHPSAFNQRGSIAISDPAGGGSALTVGGNAQGTTVLSSSTFQGTIQDHSSGPGSVTKIGSNTIIFAGDNTYTGTTTIEAGTLITDNLTGDLIHTAGTFSPGKSPAATTIGGDYTLTDASTVLIEIGGLTQGTDYDFLDIGGSMTANGVLEVTLINGFDPGAGDRFSIVYTAIGLTGTFDTLDLPSLADGLEWSALSGANTFELVVVPEPESVALVLGFLGLAFVLQRRSRF